ncbi:hypothetical protein Tco_0574614, partial [Tanacetum coccineum]
MATKEAASAATSVVNIARRSTPFKRYIGLGGDIS